jgi:hypothetical protein
MADNGARLGMIQIVNDVALDEYKAGSKLKVGKQYL